MRFGVVVLAASLAAQAGGLPAKYLAAKDIQRGMKGYGLSVFQGTKVERFEVEVLGVLTNAFPKQNIVVARMSGAGLEKTGIIAGMSGSPIYLKVGEEHKLAGAVAYGWAFPKDPVCGITPFENMYAVTEATAPEEKKTAAEAKGSEAKLDAPVKLGRRSFSDLTVAAGPPSWDELSGGAARLYRLRTPLTIGGMSPAVFEIAREQFEPLGFLPVQGGGAGADVDARNLKLEPGSALAVVLCEGDLDMSGSGTCTEVMGNTVLGFGHPMFGEGRVSVPMATAVVHYSFPSVMRSFKLTSPVATVGGLTADMQAAVMGEVGKVPRMIPIEARLTRADLRGKEVYRCRAFDHPSFTARIVAMFLSNSLVVHGDFPRENTLRFKATLHLAKRPPIELENVYSDLSSTRALFSALFDIMRPVATLGQNEFGKVDIERITADFEVSAEATTATLEAVRLERNDYLPGETVRVLATLKPHKKDPVVQTLELKLPDDVAAGTANVLVCDATTSASLDRAEAPHRYQARDLDHLVAILREQSPQRRLHIRMQLPDRGIAVRGIELPSLPASLFPIIASQKTTGLSLTGKSLTAHVETPFVVSGRHQLSVLIRER